MGLFSRRKKNQNGKLRTEPITSGPTPTPTSTSIPQLMQTNPHSTPSQPSETLDLWQIAYDQLDERERNILSTEQTYADLKSNGYRSPPNILIEKIIQSTAQQYEVHRQKDEKLRQSYKKIINAALSFKDIIGAVAAADPTHHAASAWTIVSLGLTIAQNHNDLRDALFQSSEYLADVLAQCAFLEENFYRNGNSRTKENVGSAMVKVYKAILHYTVQIRNAQDPNIGGKLLDCVIVITKHPLTRLKDSIEKEREHLRRWVEIGEYLHHEEQAARILNRIDNLAESLNMLIEQFGLVNLRIAEGAFYDSYVNQHEDFCLPDTRTELRRQIREWAESSESQCIFWLNGMAGTGKSTIARTVAQSFKDGRLLGATFFFKRGEADRGNAKYLISTIIRQLVIRHHVLVPEVMKAITKDPNLSSKSLGEQFDKLLLQPLLRLNLNVPQTTVLIIDALDECDWDDIRVILQLLPQLQKSMSLRVRVFLTSRPEIPIRLGFTKHDNHQDLVLHELPTPVIEHDIRLFLKDRLSRIREEDDLLSSTNWPAEEDIEKLVTMSVPLFIFAATLCRFIGDMKQSPQKRLAALLQSHGARSTSQMKSVYEPVLEQLLNPDDEDESKRLEKEFCDIVGSIILLAEPLSVNTLGQLLLLPEEDRKPGDIGFLLRKLHSVLSVPQNPDVPVRILHLSFRDFLVNTTGTFHVEEREIHRKLALHCLRVMNGLKRNICGLPSYGIERDEIDSYTVSQHLSVAMQYSCRYWVYHLEQSRCHISEFPIFDFLRQHFLHWLEALSLMDILSEAVGMMDMLQAAVAQKNTNAEISEFLYDARRFILRNIYMTSIAPLQLYYSALVFSPQQSIVRKVYSDNIPKWICPLPQVEATWSYNLQTLTGHSSRVNSIVFSSNGSTLASGSGDNTIKLWDVKTGKEVLTLTGHSREVNSVAFSSDGSTLASGSGDKINLASHEKTIKLWDVKTGKELLTLTGHSGTITSVAFSSDGSTLASGSYDQTIKLWDVKTGKELLTLTGHSSRVNSVAFSSDGSTLASGSDDKTIKLWDAKTGKELQTLTDHFASISSVAFPSEDHPIPFLHRNNNPDHFHLDAQLSLCNYWVSMAGEKLIYLPPEYRQLICAAVKGATIALGYSDGRVLVIGFHTP